LLLAFGARSFLDDCSTASQSLAGCSLGLRPRCAPRSSLFVAVSARVLLSLEAPRFKLATLCANEATVRNEVTLATAVAIVETGLPAAMLMLAGVLALVFALTILYPTPSHSYHLRTVPPQSFYTTPFALLLSTEKGGCRLVGSVVCVVACAASSCWLARTGTHLLFRTAW
jgi:hypothetical protein